MLVYLCDRTHGIFRSDGKRQAEPPFLDFLLHGEGIKCFVNVDYDLANLTALVLEPAEMQTLAKMERVWLHDEGMNGYGITYFPDKMVSISRTVNGEKEEQTFADLSQYAESYKRADNRGSTPELCMALAVEAGKLAQEVYNAYVKFGFTPKHIISAPNVFRHERLEHMDLPSVEDESIPLEVLEYAQECCKGGWTDCYTLGHWDHVYDYDMRSAYPAETAKLLDIRRGTWKHTAEYVKEARYGYCRCEVMTDSPFHPILHDVGSLTVAGNGVYHTSLTKAEIDFISEFNLGFVTILDGYWWVPKPTVQHELFKGVVQYLYKCKEAATGMDRGIAKRMLNGTFYGLFLQLTGPQKTKPGKFYMSPYGAEIQANTRLRVARACLENGIVPLHIAVDGFVSPKRLAIEGEGLGSWKLSHEGAAIVAGTMLWAIQGKQGEGDFSVSYDWLREAINQAPKANEYTKSTRTVLTLGKAVAEHRESEIGRVVDAERSVNVSEGEYKRLFLNLPKCGGDLLKHKYKSIPLEESLVGGSA